MENLRGAALMTLSMLGFAFEDALIKGLAETISPGQIIAVLGGGGALFFAIWMVATARPVLVPQMAERRVLMRAGCEGLGTALFVSSLALVPLTLASAVIQATPLIVAMGAALFLGHAVGWRRWSAILVGFAGVLLILKPWEAGFDPAILLSVGGMLALAARDLVTRALNSSISGPHLSMSAFAVLVPVGLALALAQGQSLVMPSLAEAARLLLCILIGIVAYLAIVAATRSGDVAFISSFRYTRMLFALGIGWYFFGETVGPLTLLGVAIVIGAGLFTLIREARLRR